MNLNSFVLDQFFRKFDLPKSSLKTLRIASSLADIEREGFPKELFQVSIPVITRGLLNFALLQTHRDWIYPYWVEQQLDPKSPGFIPRSQNPLLINVTHRNWTALGTLHGYHEAIVDPRGLATPLPREWSIDVWFAADGEVFFPSRARDVHQSLNVDFPHIATSFSHGDFTVRLESFVGETRRNCDVLFNRAVVTNTSPIPKRGFLCVVLRPFNPEGVSPIESIRFEQPRIISVHGAAGIVLSEKPDGAIGGNALEGDAASIFRTVALGETVKSILPPSSESCEYRCASGMATLGGVYIIELQPSEHKVVCWSAALDNEKKLQQSSLKPTWRVSYDRRWRQQSDAWKEETERGMRLSIMPAHLQNLFQASRNALLMFHDGSFISPGPYLYHHFWFRDAAPMLRALDLLGYHERVREAVNSYQSHLTADGHYRAPGGEWDSNGAVLWSIAHHYRLTRSFLWLKHLFPTLVSAARWIRDKRSRSRDTGSTHRGLMPPGLSAEHLGTVDQYYWDSFWSLAGMRSVLEMAGEVNSKTHEEEFLNLMKVFKGDLLRSMNLVMERNRNTFIPSSPSRPFDETAVGTIAALYPLMLDFDGGSFLSDTLDELAERYVDARGFFHPFIHSGYNAYLTMQIAHSYLWLGKREKAWEIASSVFRNAPDPYSIPEAIHPVTRGGSMGDGHHGWAAAEIVLFLRDCFVTEAADVLRIFPGIPPESRLDSIALSVGNAPTDFGTISCDVRSDGGSKYSLHISSNFHRMHPPCVIEVTIPSRIRKVTPTIPGHFLGLERTDSSTVLKLSPDVTTLFFECQDAPTGAK